MPREDGHCKVDLAITPPPNAASPRVEKSIDILGRSTGSTSSGAHPGIVSTVNAYTVGTTCKVTHRNSDPQRACFTSTPCANTSEGEVFYAGGFVREGRKERVFCNRPPAPPSPKVTAHTSHVYHRTSPFFLQEGPAFPIPPPAPYRAVRIRVLKVVTAVQVAARIRCLTTVKLHSSHTLPSSIGCASWP